MRGSGRSGAARRRSFLATSRPKAPDRVTGSTVLDRTGRPSLRPVAATYVFFTPFGPGFAANPYEQYDALRAAAPVFEPPFGIWLLTRYDDVLRVLRDPALSVEARNATLPLPLQAEMGARAGEEPRGSRAMLNLDPPDHD